MNIMFPYRADLSGLPLGFLLIVGKREIGFHLPTFYQLFSRFLDHKFKYFESISLVREAAAHDWDLWPEVERKVHEAAERRKLVELGPDARVVSRRTRCDYRPDLKEDVVGFGRWQLYHAMVVEMPR